MSSFKTAIREIFLGVFLVIAVFVWYGVWAEDSGGILTVAFLDVGQGDAIFIETPEGKQVLIDSGPNKKVLRELSKQMSFYDRSIDVIIMTHPDSDHIGGFPAILESYTVDMVLESGVTCQNSICDELNRLLEKKDLEKEIVQRGTVINLGSDVYLEVLFPDRKAVNFETNLASLVIKVVYKGNSFLLTGDSPKQIEEYLSSLDPSNLDVDVLKLGHHGSKTSSSQFFIGYTSPYVAVISAGADNRYGHPHQEVLDILDSFEIDVLRTDQKGTIIIKSDGKDLFY
ncbi:MAG: ComEC/Rec2 family competence protein [Patescibacteria group bacterium]|nr:ComEC/Rec2 family competence protein [Patescibacteria group bacterium]